MSMPSVVRPIGRPKKKPDFDAEALLTDLIGAVIESYNSPDDGEEHKPISRVAEEFKITPLKVRKLLITGGAFKTPISETVLTLYRSGRTILQIQDATGLSRASVHSYLPYSKGAYKGKEISTDAERVCLYRARKAAIRNLSVETLWDAVDLYAGFPFRTAKGFKFAYTTCENLMFVDCIDEPIERAMVESAYQKTSGEMIANPKQLGIFGADYLYPMFIRFGIISAVTSDCAASNPMEGDPIASDSTASDPTGSDPTGSDPTVSNPTVSEPTVSEPMANDFTADDPPANQPTASNPTASEPTVSDSTADDPPANNPVEGDPTASGPTANQTSLLDNNDAEDSAACKNL